MKKRFFLLTTVLALLGAGQALASVANSANNNSDLVDGNIVIKAPHATFTIDGEHNIGTNGDNGYSIYANLPKNTSSTLTLSWSADPECEFHVMKVEFKAKGYTSNALKAGSCVVDFNGSQKAIGTASLNAGGSFASFSAEGELSSGMTIVYTNTGGAFPTTFDCYLKNVSITYTVTPKDPVAPAETQTINVTVDPANLTANAPQTVSFEVNEAFAESVEFEATPNSGFGRDSKGDFYGLVAGTYTVKARIAAKENSHEASNWSEAVTIVVNRLDQTLSWVDEAAINTNMIIDSEQKITAVATSGRAVTYTSSNADVLSVDAEGNLKAKAEGEATITVSRAQDDQYNAAESISKTFKVRLKDTPFFKPVDFVTLDSCAVRINEEATIELSYVSDGLDGDFTATPADESVISVSREGNILTIHPLKVGATTLTLSQKECAAFYGDNKTYKIEVLRKANAILVNGVEEYAAEVAFESNTAIVFGSNNTDLDAPAFVVEQLSGEEFAKYEEGVVIAAHSEGTATFKVSQAQSENYSAAECVFSVTVKRTEEATCYVLDDPELQEWGTINRTKEYPVSGPAAKLIFQAKRTAILGFSSNSNFFAEYSETESGDNWNRLEPYMNLPETGKWYDFEYTIPEGTKRVRMRTETGATGNRHIQNVKVTRKTYIRPEEVALELFPQEAGEGVLKVDYSVANGGDLKLACDNDLFSLDSYSIASADCSNGKAEIPVHFAAQEEQNTYTANVTIYNAVYSQTVQLKAEVRKLTPEIAWEDYEIAFGENAALNAESDYPECAILYELVDAETKVLHIEDGKIYGDNAGTAQVKAYIESSVKFNETEKIITVTVNQAQQSIEWTQEFPEIKVGDEPFQLEATASSGLDVTFESSDPSIAYIDAENKLYALASGEVTITAKQAGTENIAAVASEPRALTILAAGGVEPVDPSDTRKKQTIIWEPESQSLNIEEADGMSISAYTQDAETEEDLELEIYFVSSDSTVAYVKNDEYGYSWLVVLKEGTVVLTAVQAGDETYQPASVSKTFIIHNADITGFEETETGAKAVKIVREGQIFILRGGKIYNLAGQVLK